jgi:hypothetical protein
VALVYITVACPMMPNAGAASFDFGHRESVKALPGKEAIEEYLERNQNGCPEANITPAGLIRRILVNNVSRDQPNQNQKTHKAHN